MYIDKQGFRSLILTFWYRKFNSFEILLIIIYSVVNLNISKGLSFMDTRLLVIAGPLLVAASWALFNIGRLAIQQIQRMK